MHIFPETHVSRQQSTTTSDKKYPTLFLCVCVCVCLCVCMQATELAELTSKISQLEDAKKKKDEEANKWQKRVRLTRKRVR